MLSLRVSMIRNYISQSVILRGKLLSFMIAFLAVSIVGVVGINMLHQSHALTGDLIRPFAANSPLNVPIPSNPVVDPKSAAYVSEMLGTSSPAANTTDYSNAIFDDVTSSTPRYVVNIPNDSRSGGNWGYNILYGVSIPIPDDAAPPVGTDGTVVIVDRAAGKTYYLWQFKRTSAGITSSWPASFDLNGFGITADPRTGRGTGAGISQLAGTIRVQEMANGSIDHALAFSANANVTCGAPNNGFSNPHGDFRWPAVATDGHLDITQSPNCLPYGMRVQLDPSINFNDTAAYPNLAPGERMIAKAMQKYGAYLVDSGGGSMNLSFETHQTGEPTYCQLGLAPAGSWGCPDPTAEANYWSFPWMNGHLRVLADCQCGTTSTSTPIMSTPGSSPIPTSVPGDVNGDGHVNSADIALLLSNWNKQSGATLAQGDLNGDGKVTSIDLAILLSNWGK